MGDHCTIMFYHINIIVILQNIFLTTLHILQKKPTKFGSQNFGYQIWFCTRLHSVSDFEKICTGPLFVYHSCQPSRFLRDSPEFNSLSRLPDPASFCPGFKKCPIKMNDSMFCSYFCSCNQKQRSVKPFDSQRFECGMIIGYLCMVINQPVPSWSGLKPILLTLFTFHFQHPAQFEMPGRPFTVSYTLCRINSVQSQMGAIETVQQSQSCVVYGVTNVSGFKVTIRYPSS